MILVALFLILIVTVLIIGGVALGHSDISAKDKKFILSKMQSTGSRWGYKCKLFTGLPIAPDTECYIFYGDVIRIEAAGHEFILPIDRVLDISIVTNEQIQKGYVSSAGGAVAGGLMFGVLGAALGGRPKATISKIFTHFLVFTYSSDEGETKFIAFNATNCQIEARRLIKRFSSEHPRSESDIKRIEL